MQIVFYKTLRFSKLFLGPLLGLCLVLHSFSSISHAELPGDELLPRSVADDGGLDADKLKEPGTSIGEQFSLDGEHWEETQYGEHPWYGGNPQSDMMWELDSYTAVGPYSPLLQPFAFQRFMRCFEPRIILPVCPFYCYPPSLRPEASGNSCPVENNTGFTFAFWWPENIIEVNDFGISALNPAAYGRADLVHPHVADNLRQVLETELDRALGFRAGVKPGGFPDNFPDGIHQGRTKYSGILPGDQTQVVEAHVYSSFVNARAGERRNPTKGYRDLRWKKAYGICWPLPPIWYNGYKKGNAQCFYSTVPEKKPVVKLWTEEPKAAMFWRFPEMSRVLNGQYYRIAGPNAIPRTNPMSPTSEGEPAGLIIDGLTYYGSYPRERSCSAYRVAAYPERYGQLAAQFGIVGNEWNGAELVCYKGGGQLFPITGTMMGHFSPLPTAAYFARRALYLSERMPGNRTPFFSDKADKLQRVYPSPSECFRANDIDDLDVEQFPPNAVDPNDWGSIRLMQWEMRSDVCVSIEGFILCSFHFLG